MNEIKQSLETYKAIKEDYAAIFARRAKGTQVSELELEDFIGRIKDAWPQMYAREQRTDLREMTIIITNLIDYMQTSRGKTPFKGVDFSLWNILHPNPAIVTLDMMEEATV